MKRILLISAIIVVLISIVAPRFIANTFNQELESMVALIDQKPVYNASITDRTTTWFSSTATVNIGFDSEVMAQGNDTEALDTFNNLNIDLIVDAEHGPILFDKFLALGWLRWTATVAGDSFRDTLVFAQGTPFYQLSSHTDLFGMSSFEDTIPSFKIKDDSVFSESKFSGWNGTGHYSNSEASYQGKLGQIMVSGALGEYQLSEWKVSSSIDGNLIDALNGKLTDSTGSLSIQDITLTLPSTQEKTTLSKVRIDTITDFDQSTSLLDTQINFSMQELQSSGLNLSSVRLNTEVNNLQEQFLMALQALSDELGIAPEKVQDKVKTFMQTELLAQLQLEPEFNISSFEAMLNQGKISGSLGSKIHGVLALPESLESPAFWLQHLQANGQLSADDSAVMWLATDTIKSQIQAAPNAAQMTEAEITAIAEQQSSAVLQSLQQQGLLTKSVEGYQIVFSIDQGQATLNDKPMPLPISQ